MAQLVVRDLTETVKRRLKARARSHRRSLEAEVRDILSAAVAVPKGQRGAGTRFRSFFEGIEVDLEAPPHDEAVPPDFE